MLVLFCYSPAAQHLCTDTCLMLIETQANIQLQNRPEENCKILQKKCGKAVSRASHNKQTKIKASLSAKMRPAEETEGGASPLKLYLGQILLCRTNHLPLCIQITANNWGRNRPKSTGTDCTHTISRRSIKNNAGPLGLIDFDSFCIPNTPVPPGIQMHAGWLGSRRTQLLRSEHRNVTAGGPVHLDTFTTKWERKALPTPDWPKRK